MKPHKCMLLAALALIAMLVLATGSAGAKAIKTPFTGRFYECLIDPPPAPERVWFSDQGTVLHVRGSLAVGRATSGAWWYNADMTGVGNVNVNMVTGSGDAHGTFRKDVDPPEGDSDWHGGFEGTWSGEIIDFLWFTEIVGHGWGDLAGTKYFATFVPDPAFVPQPISPNCELATVAYDVTGVFLDPHGVFDANGE